MTKISRSIAVMCPPARVFAVLADVERLSELTTMTVSVRKSPGRPVVAGDTFEQVIEVIGIELETDWEVTASVTDSLLRFEGHSGGGGRAVLTERVTSEGRGCRVRFDIDYDPPLGVLGDLADKVLFEKRHEHETERILQALKDLCEAHVST